MIIPAETWCQIVDFPGITIKVADSISTASTIYHYIARRNYETNQHTAHAYNKPSESADLNLLDDGAYDFHSSLYIKLLHDTHVNVFYDYLGVVTFLGRDVYFTSSRFLVGRLSASDNPVVVVSNVNLSFTTDFFEHTMR